MLTDDPLVLSTYGLVVATALLVVATAIPTYQRWRESKQQERAAAGRLIPDMNILLSRLNGAVKWTLGKRQLTEPEADHIRLSLKTELKMTADLIENSYSISLRFANELYILQHLLTQCDIECKRLLRSHEGAEEEGVSDMRRDTTARMCRLYQSASITLRAAEALLPRETRLIDGKSFWDRFDEVSRDRENEAEKALVDMRGGG